MKRKSIPLSNTLSILREYRACIIAIAIFFTFQALFLVSGVEQISMYPTFDDGDFVLSLRHPQSYNTGDIVILRAPDRNDGTYYVKRIVATEGDTLSLSQDGTLVITGDDATRNTPYAVRESKQAAYPITLTSEQFYVIGDNYTVSNDSRTFGTIEKGDIVAKVICQIPDNLFLRLAYTVHNALFA
jgi:signal peptidase I